MDEFTIQVTPEILVETSGNVEKYAEKIRSTYAGMQDKVRQTESYWVGDAGNLQRTLFARQNSDMEEIVRRFVQQAEKLQKIAQTYSGARASVNEVVLDLPSDVIE